ncbi:hypothetical protein ROLI_000660 [Roseobacter fucihabitans]|uniref:Flagellar hook-length control protein-like C-terminal domain-containing protein n=1 Tax=Roseobacter fucihabitans TaxID=1537242 RepID=A0ABZ2BME7_9RHOB|nr:flagellar hook-length control protein FliK [Roseobacter litoralis]MBC6966475.1 Flagellar hook-length control protein FliK [Roseobacter litoralis]
MLDIPMMQPPSKTDRNVAATPKDTTNSAEAAEKEVDFDTAYSAETEREAAETADEPRVETVDNAEDELLAVETDDLEEESKEASTTVDLVEKPVMPESGLVINDQPTKQTDMKKSLIGTNELVFSQILASSGAKNAKAAFISEDSVPVLATQRNPEPKDALSAAPTLGAVPSKQSQTVTFETSRASGQTASPNTEQKVAEMQTTRTAEAVLPATAQATASVINKQPEQPVATQVALPEVVEAKPDRRIKRTAAENGQTASEVSVRTDPKGISQQIPLSKAPTTIQPLTIATAQPDISGLDTPMIVNGDLDAPAPWDARGAATATTSAHAISRPETASMVGRQMAEVLHRMPDRPVEVALNPEELGRVRLSISATEGGITVSVLAERPETLDLMRRHIDQLAREFQTLGYSNINFAFNEGNSDQNSSQNDQPHTASNANTQSHEPEDGSITPITLATATGVDLRL